MSKKSKENLTCKATAQEAVKISGNVTADTIPIICDCVEVTLPKGKKYNNIADLTADLIYSCGSAVYALGYLSGARKK